MGTTILEGPYLVTYTGGTASKPPTPVTSTVPQWRMVRTKSTVARKRPPGIPAVPPTAYSATSSYQTRGYVYGSFGNRSIALSIGSRSLDPHMTTMFDSEMQYAFLEKVKSTTWNLGTFIGELPETIGFFADGAMALWKSYKAVKRGNLRKMRRILSRLYREYGIKHVWKKFSDVWLGWRYGVQPLVMEAESMMKALADTGLRLFLRRVSSRRTKTDVKSVNTPLYTQTWSAVRVARRGAYFSVAPHYDEFKKFGLLNALEVLWELTPLSFVMDWWIPVGSAITSLDAEAGVSYVNKWKSSLVYQDNAIFGTDMDSQLFRERAYVRSANGDSIPLPVYSPHMSVVRYFDTIALLRMIAR